MKQKKDNHEEIEAWAKKNTVKILKPGKAQNATSHGSICSGSFSSRVMARAAAKKNWLSDKHGGKGNRKKKLTIRRAIYAKFIAKRQRLKRIKEEKKERAREYKAKKLFSILKD